LPQLYFIPFSAIIGSGGDILFARILELLNGLGLPGLFAGVFLEAMGLPFPGSVLVALAGFLAKQGAFNVVLAWLVAMVAYLLGAISAFMVGRHMGGDFITRWGKYFHLTPKRIARAQALIQKSAPAYVIGGRFVPTIGNITPYIAGVSGISPVKFLIYDMVHAVLWLTTFIGAGFVLGDNWHQIMENPWLKWAVAGGGLMILAYVFWGFLPEHAGNNGKK
jgi:membrane protein DedA with SNARE-associated domain